MQLSKEFEKTNVFSVDMVASAVEWHAKNLKPLKTIYLKKHLFQEFKNWAQEMAQAEIEELTFKHIAIKQGSDLMVIKNDIYFDFYPMTEA